MTEPALIRHRSPILVALIIGGCFVSFMFLAAMAAGLWMTALATLSVVCLICWAFKTVRDYRP